MQDSASSSVSTSTGLVNRALSSGTRILLLVAAKGSLFNWCRQVCPLVDDVVFDFMEELLLHHEQPQVLYVYLKRRMASR
jgi:hypothetical protein